MFVPDHTPPKYPPQPLSTNRRPLLDRLFDLIEGAR